MVIRALPILSFALILPLNSAYGQPQPPRERTKLAQVDTNTQGGVQHHAPAQRAPAASPSPPPAARPAPAATLPSPPAPPPPPRKEPPK
jgi:hypothetical protein